MNLQSRFEAVVFYLRKHGFFGCVKIAARRLSVFFLGQWEYMYALDLCDLNCHHEGNAPIELLSFKSKDQIDAESLAQMGLFKSQSALFRFLSMWFSRGATLWLSRRGVEVVGVQWTLESGINGFYSLPVRRNEVIVVAVEVFPPYRGQGIYPFMANALYIKLKEAGYRRVFLKVAKWNEPMQKSIQKTQCEKLGLVYTRSLGKKLICIWNCDSDRKSSKSQVRVAPSKSRSL